VCAYHCAQLSYTTQHRTVLTIIPPNLKTIITVQMPSIEGEGDLVTFSNENKPSYIEIYCKHTLGSYLLNWSSPRPKHSKHRTRWQLPGQTCPLLTETFRQKTLQTRLKHYKQVSWFLCLNTPNVFPSVLG